MKENNTVKELPVDCRPYEKFEVMGPRSLSDSELLAIIIRTGSKGQQSIDLAKEILNLSVGNEGILGILHLTLEQLQILKGVGRVKAIQIKCIAELSRRISKTNANRKLDFSSPGTIADYYMEDLRHRERELLFVAMLNSKYKLFRELIISEGTIKEAFMDPREIFREALRSGAVNICILHNHPSGDPTPSQADIISTKRLKEAGDLIGISVIDHIIIGDNKHISLKEHGLL